ncbi:MAG: methionine--tRNA ligase, partial [Verrucomicrobiota bacterium]
SFHTRYQSELGNNLGNLVQRTISMLNRYRDGIVPEPTSVSEADQAMQTEVVDSILKFRELMENWNIHMALTELWRGITRANQYVEESAPWKLAKEEEQTGRLDTVLNRMISAIYLLVSELESILPDITQATLEQMGNLPVLAGEMEPTWPQLPQGHQVSKPTPLFPRIELEAESSS